jgi:hypothetical protein
MFSAMTMPSRLSLLITSSSSGLNLRANTFFLFTLTANCPTTHRQRPPSNASRTPTKRSANLVVDGCTISVVGGRSIQVRLRFCPCRRWRNEERKGSENLTFRSSNRLAE